MKAIVSYLLINILLTTNLFALPPRFTNLHYKQNLQNDYTRMITKYAEKFPNLNETKFLSLFHEGLEESIGMLLTEHQSKNGFSKHNKCLNKGIKVLEKVKKVHPIYPKKTRIYRNGTSRSNKYHYRTFANFRGSWYGKWRSSEVEQYWMSPHYSKTLLTIRNKPIRLKAFQTVNIGDGIGWNYTVEMDNHLYILGYTCHFDQHAEIYLKRPHIGLINKKDGIIWITKDHFYLEFICKEEACINMPLHYSISGLSYKRENGKLNILECFQTVYEEEPSHQSKWVSIKQ